MSEFRQIQTNLPWSVRYSRDFRANPQSHKDFAHALAHVHKAGGKLAAIVDDFDIVAKLLTNALTIGLPTS